MGILDDIFGPSGGGIETVETLTPGQRGRLNDLTSSLESLFGQGLTPFTGQRVAGTSPLQQTGFGLAGGLAPGIGAGIDLFGQSISGFNPQQGQNFLGQAQGALQQGLQPFDPQVISDAFAPSRQLALNQFRGPITEGILERRGATSRDSGALNQALAEAGANLSLGLRGQEAPFIGQGALQAPGLQLQGAGLGGNLAQLPGVLAGQGTQLGGQGIQALGSLFGAGAEQRNIAQQQITGDVTNQLDARSILAQFLPLALGTQAIQNFQLPSGPSPFSQVSGLFGSGGAFGSSGAFGPFTE